MIMNNKSNLIYIHSAVFLFGLAGLFAKLIDLSSTIIVLGRVTFATLALGITLLILKQSIKLSKQKDYFLMIVTGFILVIHWVSFFQAIKTSTVAIGLLSFSTFPVFSTFLEPLLFKEKLKLKALIVALISFSGVVMIIPTLHLNNNITPGVLWGVLSGFTFALLSILNRKLVAQYSALVVAFYQDFIAFLILLPLLFIEKPPLNSTNILLLVLLGIVFTAVAHSLFIRGLSTIKAQTASIIANLEPVYGIIFAVIILSEVPTVRVIIGGTIILGAALYSTINAGNLPTSKKRGIIR